jgi:inorganic pyrophosphatase
MRIENLCAIDKLGYVRAIVENPKGSQIKYKYDPETGLFLSGISLQGGMTFPFDFGFIPSTIAEDGDPLDVILLMDQPTFPGCLVQTYVIGVLEAVQIEDGKSIRNDRLIAVHVKSIDYADIQNWQDLPHSIREQMESFFVYENDAKGRQFKPLDWRGPKTAFKLLNQALAQKTKRKRSA